MTRTSAAAQAARRIGNAAAITGLLALAAAVPAAYGQADSGVSSTQGGTAAGNRAAAPGQSGAASGAADGGSSASRAERPVARALQRNPDAGKSSLQLRSRDRAAEGFGVGLSDEYYDESYRPDRTLPADSRWASYEDFMQDYVYPGDDRSHARERASGWTTPWSGFEQWSARARGDWNAYEAADDARWFDY